MPSPHGFRSLMVRLRDRVRRSNLAVVSACVLLTAGIWVFIEIADEVAEGETMQFDAWVDGLVRPVGDGGPAGGDGGGARDGRPVGPDWLSTAALDITALGSAAVLIVVVALVAAFLALKRDFQAMAVVLIATVMGQVINSALKAFFDRDRPDAQLHLVEVTTASFPSGHSMMSAVTYLTLGALIASFEKRRRMKVFAIAAAATITMLVGVTRVYLGVHYATDVLAGWSGGLTWALTCWLVSQWMQRKAHA